MTRKPSLAESLFRWGARTLLAALLLGFKAHPAESATYHVGPGQEFSSVADIPWSQAAPGDTIFLHGNIIGNLIITSQGTATSPVHIMGAPGNVVHGSLVLQGARYVQISGVNAEGSSYPAFVIRNGAADDTIENSQASHAGIGIWIGSGAGGGHKLLRNSVHDNRGDGIAIDRVNCAPGTETVISGNTVNDNATHGIEISGNWYVVEHNIVYDNGKVNYGASGIHTFAFNAAQNAGKHNVIRYNVVYNTHDVHAGDGNGIELDQWCDDNRVSFNLAFHNDGAGIVVFDAADNVIENNTLFANARDPGNTHPYRADLVIASDYTKQVDHAFGNIVRNNLVLADGDHRYAIFVDDFASHHMKEIANNDFSTRNPAAALYFWAGRTGRDIAAWNKLKPGTPDFSAIPAFSNPDAVRFNGHPNLAGFVPRNLKETVELKDKTNCEGTDLAGRHFTSSPIGALTPAD